METFPELHTSRLTLRKVQLSDVYSLLKYANNRAVSDNILNFSYPYQEEDAVFWINRAIQSFKSKERFIFAIVLKETSEFIGAVGVHVDTANNMAEVGYWLGEPFWGKGMMSEALQAALNFGFNTLGLHRMYATVFPDNKGSEKVLINNGMIKEGEMKDNYRINGVYKSVYLYRLIKDEYDSLNAQAV